MALSTRPNGRFLVALSLTTSLLLANSPLSFAGPGDTNSTNYGENVAGGTYYNTTGNRTTFTNNGNMIVGAGTTVRGLEVNNNGDLTGNGGHLHFDARGGVMRVDGTIDASAALGQNGAYLGNGGKVTIDAGALVQNGNIFANGLNGGTIVFNVGQLTVDPGSRIEALATGANALPGQININATGQVTIPNGAVIDASGNYVGGYNANVIQISGSVVNLDGVVMANGLSAGAKGGAIGIYGSEIALGSNAKVTANGAEGGQGGAINVAATEKIAISSGAEITANGGLGASGGAVLVGAALDSSGNVGLLTKSVENNGLIAANGGDGDSGVDAGNGGVVVVLASNSVSNTGRISADGGNGFNGYNPSNGGNGGKVGYGSDGDVGNSGRITANGGNGGTNPNVEQGPVSETQDEHGNVSYQQVSLGQNGGRGGNGGEVRVAFNTNIRNDGSIEVVGGNGGNGQEAQANETDYQGQPVHQYALAGNGGDAGNGGKVLFHGEPGQDVLNNVNVNGGSGGQGGNASTSSACGCATPGAGGACGAPGEIHVTPKPPCAGGGTCSPPPKPPENPLFPLYPKEYGTLGDTLPPNAGNVLSYNRSIFLARSPLPIIQKKTPPAPPPPPPAKIMLVKPKPKPPQKKVPVRGYW
ncbi:hypothetical protein [Vampirovibrio chlorellavorus]|uniref:hypothetical protein n=1 Tax=Vampirovibrio chlorellavorus TaxID=758823 RepID=UPI0026ECD6AE|nr:hypothetical protein [Vampirovibrio chlorellavorus]